MGTTSSRSGLFVKFDVSGKLLYGNKKITTIWPT